ncbi:DNA glycosylase [Rhodotorula diobovata]|uniref:Endonuclease III homolog n=1 Tax=Rhodotorula diobovata TaxID=5288 RepID=A0A5C5G6X2_9BASI|nr:DNA glycosylase [Rhodotorula diobovata]
MAPLRTRTSTHSARVTLYEPAGASSSPTATRADPHAAAAAPSMTPHRRTRSSTAASSPAVKYDDDGDAAPAWEAEADSDFAELKPASSPKKQRSSPKKQRSPRKPKAHVEKLAVPHPAPKTWQRTYEVICKQREGIVAAVDTMGCEQGGREAQKKEEDEGATPVDSDKARRLSTLVSLMLSSQTKDPVTHQATVNLRNDLPGGLTIDALEKASVEQIDECIKKVGFHQTKAKNLKLLATRLKELHDGDVPSDLPSLLAIVGVGPKMSYLFLQSIGQNIGIGVDTHVHRITHRLRWHKKEPKTPEETRLNLESWLPQHLWPTFNRVIVGFGQEVCKPVAPRCDLCDVAKEKLCPSRRAVVPSPKKKVKVEVKKDGGEEGRPKVEMKLEEETEGVVAVKAEDDGLLLVEERSVKTETEEVDVKVKAS